VVVFVNMVSHEAALGFVAKWHGRKIANVPGAKRLDISVAEVQGFIGNLKHLKASNIARMRNDKLLPVAFKGTTKLDFKMLLAGLETLATSQRPCSQVNQMWMWDAHNSHEPMPGRQLI